MLPEPTLRATVERALAASTADQTEVVITVTDAALTRFANNAIHQQVAEYTTALTVRAVFGQRIGLASGADLSAEGVARVVSQACANARHAPEVPDFRALPAPRPIPPTDGWSEATARCSPEARAHLVALICQPALSAGLRAAGYVETRAEQRLVANSRGVFAVHQQTIASALAVVSGEDGSGYADRFGMDLNAIDAEGLAQEAIGRARLTRAPIELPVGEYDVVLEPYAVADLVSFVALLGFSARAVQEQTSFLCGRLGERIFGENITLWDDPTGPGVIPEPFDWEGVPSQRVELVTEGVATGLVYDTLTAGREGKESTGHALPPGAAASPLPRHLVLVPGTTDDLVRLVDRGLLVTRFWYTRTVHPLTVTVTGMTRDGLFLIERGEVVAPVKNLRFTQSYLRALERVVALGRETKLQLDELVNCRVPPVYIAGWTFTGATEF
ncbi:MAG: peptidase U62 [Dehalococcoidia bacterium]|nr:MAG: peptidase U62 [Dehalococcoidia bacterium]